MDAFILLGVPSLPFCLCREKIKEVDKMRREGRKEDPSQEYILGNST